MAARKGVCFMKMLYCIIIYNYYIRTTKTDSLKKISKTLQNKVYNMKELNYYKREE